LEKLLGDLRLLRHGRCCERVGPETVLFAEVDRLVPELEAAVQVSSQAAELQKVVGGQLFGKGQSVEGVVRLDSVAKSNVVLLLDELSPVSAGEASG